MFFIKKTKENINLSVVNEVVVKYFDYIQGLNTPFTLSEISELMRYSMCRVLNLDSCSYSSRLEELSSGVVTVLSPIIASHGVAKMGLDYRHGFLEACVHCMELSKKKVEG